jgi:hypothetical protein
MDNVCYVVLAALSLALFIYGLYLLIKGQCNKSETEVQTVQRQLRGFAFTILGQFVFIVGMAACFSQGNGPEAIKQIFGKLTAGVM